MKTERRQELKTNDLGAFLVEVNDWVREHTYQLGGSIGLVIVAVLLALYVQRSRVHSVEAAWMEISELSFTLEAADESFATVDRLVAETDDRDFKMAALLLKASNAAALVMRVDGFHPEYLDPAEQAYRALLDGYPQRMQVVAAALSGLVSVEENRFVQDGDMSHRAAAKAYLERLQNEPRFKATPFQTAAAQRLIDLDDTFQVVTLAEPPPLPPLPPPVPTTMPENTPTAAPDAAPDNTGYKPVPHEASAKPDEEPAVEPAETPPSDDQDG